MRVRRNRWAMVVLLLAVLAAAGAGAQQSLLVGGDWDIALGEADPSMPVLPVAQALAEGRVELAFTAVTAEDGPSLRVEVKNLKTEPLRLRLPAGFLLHGSEEKAPVFLGEKDVALLPTPGEERTLPVAGGTLEGIPALCAQYYWAPPATGTRYKPAPSRAQPRSLKGGSPPRGDPIRDALLSLFPRAWHAEELLQKAEARVRTLILWAGFGVPAASDPLDIAVLQVVRNRLKENDVPDPYGQIVRNPVSDTELIANVATFAGEVPKDFAAAMAAGYRSTDTAVFDISPNLRVVGIAPSQERGAELRQNYLTGVPEKIEIEQAQKFHANYLANAASLQSAREVEIHALQTSARLDGLIAALPETLAEGLRAEKDAIVPLLLDHTSRERSKKSAQRLLDAAQTAEILDDWHALPPICRGWLADYAQIAAASDPDSPEQEAFVARVFDSAPDQVQPFLKKHGEAFRRLSASATDDGPSLSESVLQAMSPKTRAAWEAEGVTEGQKRAVEEALLAHAEAGSAVRQQRQIAQSGLVQGMGREGQRQLAAIARRVNEGEEELRTGTSVEELLLELAANPGRPLEALGDHVPGKEAALDAYRLLTHLRKMAGDARTIIYRTTKELVGMPLQFWNSVFTAAELPGFEQPIEVYRTRRADISEALAVHERTPEANEQMILAVTVPTEIREEEFANPTSDFLQTVKNNNPGVTAAEYNRNLGTKISQQIDNAREKNRDLTVCRTWRELSDALTGKNAPKDCTLSITIVAHSVSDRMEFPDRPEGVSLRDLQDLVDAHPHGDSFGMETNLMVCHGGEININEFPESPIPCPVTAPRGETNPISALRMHTRTLDRKSKGESYHRAAQREILNEYREAVRRIKSEGPAQRPRLQGLGSTPQTEVKNRKEDPDTPLEMGPITAG